MSRIEKAKGNAAKYDELWYGGLMAAGYNLKEGTYKSGPISDDEMWSAFAFLFSSKSVNDTSYKFGLLYSYGCYRELKV